jgi:DNA anti-recombination protein RmuC
MMEERLTTLESKSDSNAAALAALENAMNDRFNRIETELIRSDTELRFDMLRSAEERDFKKAGEDLANSTALIREDMARRFTEMREETNRRFVELREDMNGKFADVDRRFAEQREATDRRFAEMRDEMNRRFEEIESTVNETNTFMRWMLGSQIIVVLAILGMAAKLISG